MGCHWFAGTGSAFLQHAGLFRGAQTDEAIDGVRRAMRRGVIMPDLQFTQQADGKHLDAGQDQDARNYEERAVSVHHVLMGKELHTGQEHRNAGAEKDTERAKSAEEM
jgi:hypothetical protein